MTHPPSIQQLRDQLARMAGPGRRTAASVIPVGVAEIDSQLPGCGLLRGGIHVCQAQWNSDPCSGKRWVTTFWD